MVGELLKEIVYGLREMPIIQEANCGIAITTGGGQATVSIMDLPYIFIHPRDEDNSTVHQYIGGHRHYAYRIDFYVCTQFIDEHLSINSDTDEQIKWLEFADILVKQIQILFSSKKFISLRRKYQFVAHYRKTSFKQVNAFDDSLNGKKGFVHCHVIEFGIDGIGENPFIAGYKEPTSIDIELFYANDGVSETEKIGEAHIQKTT